MFHQDIHHHFLMPILQISRIKRLCFQALNIAIIFTSKAWWPGKIITNKDSFQYNVLPNNPPKLLLKSKLNFIILFSTTYLMDSYVKYVRELMEILFCFLYKPKIDIYFLIYVFVWGGEGRLLRKQYCLAIHRQYWPIFSVYFLVYQHQSASSSEHTWANTYFIAMP